METDIIKNIKANEEVEVYTNAEHYDQKELDIFFNKIEEVVLRNKDTITEEIKQDAKVILKLHKFLQLLF